LARHLTRRDALALALAGTATLAASATVPAQESTPAASPVATPTGPVGLQPDGTWVFTDDRGVTVTLDTAPQKLVIDVNVAAAFWDFGIRPHGVFGWLSTITDGKFPPAGGRIDPAQVENYGLGEGAIDLERLAAAAPDLIVTYTFAPDDPTNLWSVLPDDLERVEAIAPIIAFSGISSLSESIARLAGFAELLGADLATPEIQGTIQGIQAAEGRAAVLVQERPVFSALWIAPSEDSFYVANPTTARGVGYARDLGVRVPTLGVEDTAYWEELSYEQAMRYPTDILFVSTRNGPSAVDDLIALPTFAQHPAVLANQVYPWNQDVIASYQGQMAVLVEILTALETANPDTVTEDWA
jgi:iron complex transport system substrate-binding protein